MIIVDTNVWSETVRKDPEPAVVQWMLDHSREAAITSITVGELLYDVAIMPRGGRRDALAKQIEGLIASASHKTFSYDRSAAREFSRIKAQRKEAGRESNSPEDEMIAAIAAAHSFAVATRNVDDFDGTGVTVVNPWNWTAAR